MLGRRRRSGILNIQLKRKIKRLNFKNSIMANKKNLYSKTEMCEMVKKIIGREMLPP